MSSTLNVEIVSPEGLIFSGKAERVFASAEGGEIGILPQHTQFLSPVKPGAVKVESGDEEDLFYISGGIVEVQPEMVSILADTVIRAEELDADAVQTAQEKAEELLANSKDEMDIAAANVELAASLAQIEVLRQFKESAAKRGLTH